MEWVQTVTGRCRPDQLGLTLVHEHLLVGYPGWQMDALAPPFRRDEALVRGVDALEELRDLGVETFLDPCPMDLGRDVEFMAEVAQRSGMRIVCTTGAYKEEEGLTYTFGALPVEEITEIYLKELEEGIGETGIRAGLIKVATGAPDVSDYERKLLTAAGRAAARAGCPVITHTDDARCGIEQIEILTREGLAPHRILVGHSDGRADHAYHRSLADRGAYVGFDRFGIELLIPDEERIQSVVAMVQAGYTRSLCLSHDANCAAWLGRPIFAGKIVLRPDQMPVWKPTLLFEKILPELRARGVKDEEIRTLLVENPSRYFSGAEPPRNPAA
ncbi:MAG: phosphotriesterase [Myxococcota bacterium]